MSADDLPIEPDRLPDAPHEKRRSRRGSGVKPNGSSPTGNWRHDSSGMLSH